MLKSWAPPNSSPAFGILIPQKLLAQGMNNLSYRGLVTDKLEKAIKFMDPAEMSDLKALPIPLDLPADPTQDARRLALEIMAAVETPTVEQPVKEAPEDEDLRGYLEDESPTDLLEALAATM